MCKYYCNICTIVILLYCNRCCVAQHCIVFIVLLYCSKYCIALERPAAGGCFHTFAGPTGCLIDSVTPNWRAIGGGSDFLSPVQQAVSFSFRPQRPFGFLVWLLTELDRINSFLFWISGIVDEISTGYGIFCLKSGCLSSKDVSLYERWWHLPPGHQVASPNVNFSERYLPLRLHLQHQCLHQLRWMK